MLLKHVFLLITSFGLICNFSSHVCVNLTGMHTVLKAFWLFCSVFHHFTWYRALETLSVRGRPFYIFGTNLSTTYDKVHIQHYVNEQHLPLKKRLRELLHPMNCVWRSSCKLKKKKKSFFNSTYKPINDNQKFSA